MEQKVSNKAYCFSLQIFTRDLHTHIKTRTMKINSFSDHFNRLDDIGSMFVCKGFTIMMLTNGEQEVVDVPLFEIEKQLCHDSFFRIHKSYIVNLSEIHAIGFNEEGMNIRINGHRLPVSRRRKRALLKVLETRRKT